jgi:glycosyltransferase involved in cell wall biosynthesis
MSSSRALRIAQVVPPLERVPPTAYGGTERVVNELLLELLRRGHDVTTFASGDSEVPGRHVATVPEALRPAGFGGDPGPWFAATQLAVLERADEFDVIHSHLEWPGLVLAKASPVPVVSTFHGRIDHPWAGPLLETATGTLVAISRSQAAVHPRIPWQIVHNGLSLRDAPFERRRGDGLCFVGRVAPEKGILDAMEIARRSGRPLRIAAKVGTVQDERDYYENVFLPALRESDAEFLGEVSEADRNALLAESYASLVPASWPEPFGLAVIESLACGTPVIARHAGALPEIVRDGIDGYFGDDVTHMAFLVDRVAELDRLAIRQSVLDRFSAVRMVDRYEALYEAVVGAAAEERQAARAGQAGRARQPVMARQPAIGRQPETTVPAATAIGATAASAAPAVTAVTKAVPGVRIDPARPTPVRLPVDRGRFGGTRPAAVRQVTRPALGRTGRGDGASPQDEGAGSRPTG